MTRRFVSIAAALLLMLTVSSRQAAAQRLRAGVASMITPVSAVRYYQQVVDYLGERLGLPAEMIHRTTYDEIDVMLEEGRVDLAFICSAPYVLDHEKFGVQLLVAPQVDGAVVYHSNIIVHKDSPISAVEDLRGKTFAFVDPKSNSGRLYPTYLLATRDENPDGFFGSYLYSYSHNKSVEIVAKKRADGAAVDSIVYDYMIADNSPYAGETRVIHRSPPFGIPPVVVPPSTPAFLRESLRSIFLEMHEDRRGREILAAMRIDRFVEVKDGNYDSIRDMRAFLAGARQESRESSSGTAGTGNATEPATIRFGVQPRDNPVMAYERYQPLIDYLSETTGIPTELQLEKTYQDVVGGLGDGSISFALLGPLTYLDAYKRFDTAPIARSRTARGEMFYRSVIVTDADRSIEEVAQLVDKKFAFGALWSTSGNLIPRYMLAWEGIHLDDLSEYHHYNYHETVAKKVISNEFEGGALRLSAAERYLPYGLKIIAVSDPIPTGPIVVSPNAPYGTVRAFQKALLNMAETENGRATLEKLDPDLQGGFVPASDADYAEIRRMINDVPRTCGTGCHPEVSF